MLVAASLVAGCGAPTGEDDVGGAGSAATAAPAALPAPGFYETTDGMLWITTLTAKPYAALNFGDISSGEIVTKRDGLWLESFEITRGGKGPGPRRLRFPGQALI